MDTDTHPPVTGSTAHRQRIWAELAKVARPDSRFHWDFSSFIPDFDGSDVCAQRVRELNACAADVPIFITPDNSTEALRAAAMADGRTILMTTYGIGRGSRTVSICRSSESGSTGGSASCWTASSARCCALCFLVIFNNSFNKYYTEFLGLLILWLSPWIAIYGVDWYLRRGVYDARGLVDESPGGRYWRNGGLHVPGVVAQLIGMTASALWIDSAAFVGPLSSVTGSSDFSVFTGLVAAGVVYRLLAGRGVRQETRDTVAAAGTAGVTVGSS